MSYLRITRKPNSVFYKDDGGKTNFMTVELSKTGTPDMTLTLVLDDGTNVTRLLEIVEFGDRGEVVTVRFRVTKVSNALEGSHFRLRVGDCITNRIKVLSKQCHKAKRSPSDHIDPTGGCAVRKRLKTTTREKLVIDNRALKLRVEQLETELNAAYERDPLTTYVWDQWVEGEMHSTVKEVDAMFL